eukprot:Mycagemm_TRINITY_DN10331_c1_g3::TRINITY_DN10331_c1_g3_i1::g.452::m.452 type:complete len:105 gc:universal TRINITY_DN10331_c1_g3_i1:428-114(-)
MPAYLLRGADHLACDALPMRIVLHILITVHRHCFDDKRHPSNRLLAQRAGASGALEPSDETRGEVSQLRIGRLFVRAVLLEFFTCSSRRCVGHRRVIARRGCEL